MSCAIDTVGLSNRERQKQIAEVNEAIDTYEFLYEDAVLRGDTEEAAFLRTQIQQNKRLKVALKRKEAFEYTAKEELITVMFAW